MSSSNSAAYVFPVMPNYSLVQTWGFAPVNPANPQDALAYANNRCYAFYLVGTGQIPEPEPNQTHIAVVAPKGFVCPYRFLT